MAWQWSRRSSGSRSKRGSRKPKWDWQADIEERDCKKCGASNWWSRRSCRQCENSGRQTDSEDGKARDTGWRTDSEDGDFKVNAVAKVVTLEEALAKLGDSPLLATARQELEKEFRGSANWPGTLGARP